MTRKQKIQIIVSFIFFFFFGLFVGANILATLLKHKIVTIKGVNTPYRIINIYANNPECYVPTFITGRHLQGCGKRIFLMTNGRCDPEKSFPQYWTRTNYKDGWDLLCLESYLRELKTGRP